jgi:hypothetical protein
MAVLFNNSSVSCIPAPPKERLLNMVTNKVYRAQGVRRDGLLQLGTKTFGEEAGLIYQWIFVKS